MREREVERSYRIADTEGELPPDLEVLSDDGAYRALAMAALLDGRPAWAVLTARRIAGQWVGAGLVGALARYRRDAHATALAVVATWELAWGRGE